MFHPWFKKPAHHLSPPLYRCSCARLLRCTASRCWCDYKAFQKQTRFFLRCLWFMGSGQQACFGTTLRKECKLSEKTSSLRSCKWVCARPSHSLFWCHTIQTTKAIKKSGRRRCADTCKPISLWHEKTRTCGRLVLFEAEERKKKAGSASRCLTLPIIFKKKVCSADW